MSDTEKEMYQAQVNDAMGRYKTEYNEWYEALTLEEQKVGVDPIKETKSSIFLSFKITK